MSVEAGMLSIPSVQEQRAALAAILSSKTFDRCPTLSALLEYLCNRQFAPDGKPTKEYDVALDVFGRAETFDASTDSIVRVEIFRLRKKLKKYYESEGAEEPLRIEMASGSYIPQFVQTGAPGAGQLAAPITAETMIEDLQSPVPYEITAGEVQPAHLENPVNRRPSTIGWQGMAGGALLVFGLVVAGLYLSRPRANEVVKNVTPEQKASVTPVNAFPLADVTDGIRVAVGSSKVQVDRAGRSWGPDRFFHGGMVSERAITTLLRTRDLWLYSHVRSGDFSYDVPLTPGCYELRLYFAEIPEQAPATMEGGENVRVFGVTANGEPLLSSFDITSDAGGITADEKVFKNVKPSTDGQLHLKFISSMGAPILSALEITPGVTGHLRPIRIVAQDKPLVDESGHTWLPDDYFLEGRQMPHSNEAAGPEDARLYRHERYGNFSYAIPVATDGEYSVTLRYAEVYWSPAGPGIGGTGSRVFDVYCNGTALQRSFDIFREAGFSHQLTKTFRHIRPTAQGKIDLSFVPSRNYALVDAIEVIDEADRR